MTFSVNWGEMPKTAEELRTLAQNEGGFANYSYPAGTVFRARLEAADLGEPRSFDNGGSIGAHIKTRWRVVACESAAGHSIFANLDPAKAEKDGSVGKKAAVERAKIMSLYQIAGLSDVIKKVISEGRLPNAQELAMLVGREYLIKVGAVDDRDTGKAGRNYLQGILYEGSVTPSPKKRLVDEASGSVATPSPSKPAANFDFGGGGGIKKDDIPF